MHQIDEINEIDGIDDIYEIDEITDRIDGKHRHRKARKRRIEKVFKLKCICSYKLNAFKALTSWLQIGAINLEAIDKNEVMHEAFKALSNPQESPNVFEAAADCVIALLIRLEDHDKTPYMSGLELNVFTTVRRLEEAYHLCVAHEDLDKASNLCRVFTELVSYVVLNDRKKFVKLQCVLRGFIDDALHFRGIFNPNFFAT